MKKIVACLLLLIVGVFACACSKEPPTETAFIEKGNTKMIAHRGLSGLEVENTESAFVAAGEHSYYGIETDIRRTGDGQFVICHDDTVNRLSGQNIPVEGTPLEELLNVELFPKKEGGKVERLTTLESYIDLCKKYNKQAILELKSDFTQEEIGRIIATIQAKNYIDKVTFISFGYGNLTFVRNILPDQPAMYLFSELSDEITEKLIRDKIDVAIYHKALTKRAVQKFHDAGLKVNCWTVDDVGRAEKLVRWGVDYITTNILE